MRNVLYVIINLIQPIGYETENMYAVVGVVADARSFL